MAQTASPMSEPTTSPSRMEASVQALETRLKYPANLLYAQGMLQSTMLEMKQVELQIEHLKAYVQKHQEKKMK